MAKKQTKKVASSNVAMSIWQLGIYIFIAIVLFWLLGLALDLAKWLLKVGLFVSLIVTIAWLVNAYLTSQKRSR